MDERGWQAVAWAVAAVAAVLLGVRLLGGGAPSPPPVELDGARGEERSAAAGEPRPTGPYVHVAGAVRRPGLYRLAPGARVAAAVRRAGGPAGRADLDLINLAARLQDGQQVVVPAAAAAAGTSGGVAAPDAPVSLGAATAEQLDELDGIGPTLAERIVEHRRASGGFRSIEQLAEVDGIGEKRLEALRAALTP